MLQVLVQILLLNEAYLTNNPIENENLPSHLG